MNLFSCRAFLLSTVIAVSTGSEISAAHQESQAQRPNEHFCPITQQVMSEPVVASDGFSYDLKSIEQWMMIYNTSPMTREQLKNVMYPNLALKAMIDDWRDWGVSRSSVFAGMTSEEIITLLQEAFAKQQHTAKGKDIVVILGNTGAGKSTLINFLAGKGLTVDGTGYVLSVQNDPEAMVIGRQVFSSETLYPKSIDIETLDKKTLRFFDLPGLDDTDGSVRNLVNSAFIRRILLDAKTVRFVYVAGQDQFTADRGQSVTRTLQVLNHLFVIAGDDRQLDMGMFVVTKEDGLLRDISSWNETNMPEQLRIWKNAGRIVPMYHARHADKNTSQHRDALLQQIDMLRTPQLLSVNVSSLYPQETRADIERMYRKMYETAYQFAEQEQAITLDELKNKLEIWESETFWDAFELKYVYEQYPFVDVLKDVTVLSYNRVRNKYIQEQEATRTANIESLKKQIENKIEATKQHAEEIMGMIQSEQAQDGEQQSYLSRALEGRQSVDQISKSNIPRIANGCEEIYLQFLNGMLVYKPNKDNDIGRKEFRIRDLTNPLSGVFDISRCGDSASYLQISTGFRTAVNPANRNKIEVWIVPQFVLQKNPRAKAFYGFLTNRPERRDKLFAILYNWGGECDLNVYDIVGEDGASFCTILAAYSSIADTKCLQKTRVAQDRLSSESPVDKALAYALSLQNFLLQLGTVS